MSVTDITGGFWFPDPIAFPQDAGGFTNLGNIGNTSELVGFIFRVPKTGTLDTVEFYLGPITTAQDLEVSFRTVQTSGGSAGFPSTSAGELYVIPLASLVASGWNVTGSLVTAGVKRSVTIGDLLAVVFRCNSATGDIMFRVATNDVLINFPYSTYLTGTKTFRPFPIAITYDDASYAYIGPTIYPWSAFTTNTFNSGSTPDEIGNKLVFPLDVEVDSAWVKSNGGNDFDLVIYDGGGSVVASVSQDGDVREVNSPCNFYLSFTSRPTLTAGATYYLVLKPTTASSVTAYEFTAGTAASLGGTQGGADCCKVSRTNAGAWTTDSDKRVFMGLHVSGISSGSSSAGSVWASA